MEGFWSTERTRSYCGNLLLDDDNKFLWGEQGRWGEEGTLAQVCSYARVFYPECTNWNRAPAHEYSAVKEFHLHFKHSGKPEFISNLALG